jgi:hypothetical protein
MSGVTSNYVSETPSGVQSLYYGDARTPLARVVHDDDHPSLWRVRWPDGRTSTPANLARTKDAALAIAERGRDHRRLHWREDRSDGPREARRRVRAPDPLSGYPDARSQPKFSRTDRTWRVVAGPDVPEINLRLPLDPDLAARQERTRVAVEEHQRKVKRAAARKARPRPVPLLDLDPPPPALHLSAPSPDDPFEIPAFLDRCRFVELEEAA